MSEITTEMVQKVFHLNDDAERELEKVLDFDFNIFSLKKFSNNNELVVLTSYIFAREKIFDNIPIENEKFIPFIKKI